MATTGSVEARITAALDQIADALKAIDDKLGILVKITKDKRQDEMIPKPK